MSSSEWKDAVKRIPRDERIVYLHLKEEIESLDRAKAFAGEQEKRQLIELVEERVSELNGRLASLEETLASIQSDMASFKNRMTDDAAGPKTQVANDPEVPNPQPQRTEQIQTKVEPEISPEEPRRRVDSYTPEEAEERYNYLSGKPITELSDAEYEERLALANRPSKKAKAPRE